MTALLAPAFAYAVSVFAVGFALGTARVLAIAPRLGEGVAVLLELPLMLLASFVLARWAVARWAVPARLGPRAAMGLMAFAILMGLELALSVLLFGNSLQDHLSAYRAPERLLGLAGQIAFGALPALLLLRAREGSGA